MRTASHPPVSVGRHHLWSQFLWSVFDLHYWTVSQSLPAMAPPCCTVKLLHLHWASPYFHNKWDIPKHNIFMLYLKPPAHYHSSNLSSRKWIPHLQRVEMWKLIVKLQMDHWEPKCVEDCSAKIKPLISGEKGFIILVSLSQVQGFISDCSLIMYLQKKCIPMCVSAQLQVNQYNVLSCNGVYAYVVYLCVYVCV